MSFMSTFVSFRLKLEVSLNTDSCFVLLEFFFSFIFVTLRGDVN